MQAHYVFRARWTMNAPARVVRSVLFDYERYPLWWPQVRSAVNSPDGVTCVVRSMLPYQLEMTALQLQLDDGTLAAELSGDIEGVAQWRLEERNSHTRMHYFQEVDLTKPVLRALSPLLWPAFRYNHRVMMRAGERGLAIYLAGVLQQSRKHHEQ